MRASPELTGRGAFPLPVQRPESFSFASWYKRLARYLRTPRGLLTLTYLVLFLAGGIGTGSTAVIPHVLTSILGACLTDAGIGGLGGKGWRWPASALLSGFTVAFVLAPAHPWGATVAVGTMATLSKHFLRKRGPVFNPAALVLLVSIPLFSTAHSWWGALGDLSWPWIALPLGTGVFIADRLNKLTLVFGFLGSYFCLCLLAGLIAPQPASEVFRAPFLQAALFLAFFMLTDPPTSPIRQDHQLVVGVLDGVVCSAGLFLGAGQAYLLWGVLAGNAAWAVARTLPVSRPVSARSGR